MHLTIEHLQSPPAENLVAANGQDLNCVGTLRCVIEYCGRQCIDNVYICENVDNFLLAWYMCKSLDILPRTYPQPIDQSRFELPTNSVSRVMSQDGKVCMSQEPSKTEVDNLKQALLEDYSDVFSDKGKLREMTGRPMKITLTEDVQPFALSAPRQIPFAYRNLVKAELEKQVAAGVIESVTEATDWVHPLVVVPKPKGGIRLCVDLQNLNKYVKRPYYPTRTPYDAVSNITPGSKFFTTLDAVKGYWQVPLEDKSQILTTFITPYGRYKFLRAPMGLASSQDEYCARGDEALQGINCVEKVVDDILIHSCNPEDNLSTVIQVLERCRQRGITLNPDKFEFMQPAVDYVGYRVSSGGIEADTKKVEAIQNFPAPTNITELRSFMGLANQLGGFSHELSKAAEPLRDLMKPKNAFLWTPNHEEAFGDVKTVLCSPPVLATFDPSLPTMLQTDASRLKGLGFALLQKHGDTWRLTQAGSRFITDTESRYAMVELELLGVVWAIRKCRIYLQGMPKFDVVVDHKPLESILNNQTMDMIDNPRIQRLKEKLCGYTFQTIWRKGKEHVIPDALSRAPCSDPAQDDIIIDDTNCPLQLHISCILRDENEINDGQPLIDPLLEEIKKCTLADKDSIELVKAIKNGFTVAKQTPSVQAFKKLADQLTVEDGLILLDGHRIVIPHSMRRDVLARLHASHQGIERTKRRARQTVYWPAINSDIQNTVQSCSKCQESLPSQQREPMEQDPPPKRPFEDVSADLFSHAGKSYLVYVDRLSGWIKITEFRHDPSSQQVISALRKYFVDTGVPVRIRTDGGPQFSASKFRQFLKRWGVNQALSTPHYPQSNGHAEAAVKAMKRLVAKSTEAGNIDSDEFCEGLLEWLNTPKAHGLSPAEILYGSQIRSIVPATFRTYADSWKEKFDSWDKKAVKLKKGEEEYYNKQAKPLPPLKIGQKVRLQDAVTRKWDRSGIIVGIGKNRDYHIRLPSGRVFWRNRRLLRLDFIEEPSDKRSTLEDKIRSKKNVRFDDDVEIQNIPPRRSKRHRRSPSRFQNFV